MCAVALINIDLHALGEAWARGMHSSEVGIVAVVPVNTRWIDETGGVGDVGRKVGRLGEDVRVFALHTLGWIRIQEIIRYREIEFDPRAVRPRSIEALIDTIRSFGDEGAMPWLAKVSAHTGHSWISITSSEKDTERLIEWIKAMAEVGSEPDVPAALEVSDLPENLIVRDQDPALRALVDRWRDSSGHLDLSSAGSWASILAPRRGGNLKVLRREASGAIVFCAYQPSLTPLWDAPIMRRFVQARVLEQVPDRALAQRVVRSAVRTLASGQPRAERFTGPCLRSDGSVEHLDWMRVSLPASSIGDDLDTVVVFCRRMPEPEPQRMSG